MDFKVRRHAIWLTLVLTGCMQPVEQPATWDLGGIEPQLAISAPVFSKDQISFVLTARNTSTLPICFDGTDAYPLGISLNRVSDGAPLAWSNVPGDRDVGHLAPIIFNKYTIPAGSALSFTVVMSRPIFGPYEVPYVSSRYQNGDLLAAQTAAEFYDCGYGSLALAQVQKPTILVLSPMTAPFREE